MINPWFKFYGSEYLSDPKISTLSAQERSCWITLLCLASTATDSGFIEFLTIEVLLQKSGITFDPYHSEEWDNLLGTLQKFERLKMIVKNDSGKIEILNWEKRQEHNLTPAERMAKMRAKKKAESESVTNDVTNVTLEKNRKEKKRKEKNNIYNSKENRIQIFDYWNTKKIVKHTSFSDDADNEVRKLIGKGYTIENIKNLIDTYAEVYQGERYYWTHKWNLYEFLKRGVKTFDGKTADDFLSSFNNQPDVTKI